MRDSREKGAGMRDQDPPFQTLTYVQNLYVTDELSTAKEWRLNQLGTAVLV